MEPQLTNFIKMKKLVNQYSDNNKYNKYNIYNNILFNIGIFIIFVLLICCFLSYKYRIKNNISF